MSLAGSGKGTSTTLGDGERRRSRKGLDHGSSHIAGGRVHVRRSDTPAPLRPCGANDRAAFGCAIGQPIEDRVWNPFAQLSRLQALGAMAGALVHDVAQPLSAIRSYAGSAMRQRARGSGNGRDVAEALRAIVAAADAAQGIVTRVREFASHRPGVRHPVHPDALVERVMAIVTPRAREAGVVLRARTGAGAPCILADAVQIQEVLVNLVINGIDSIGASPATRREVSIEALRAGDGCAEFVVRDTGPGISGEDIGRVFEPLYTTKGDGWGIGLAISRHIVEDHGGRIWAESTVCGATFRFVLPSCSDE